ncbi:FAD-dependent thymidylate synthase [Asanoa sp. WMMD1127]|uniref:FAD-dependent thymidylate synthase n=1 Tax=Asanoa sp. WMMD1127 TaxID=3016107 RepID=UPI0024174B07|nr:FAD-dependent thymidylate synthase [Asanoa sp. WMMD1127]MDG4825992.1 FAD-dependent thymidylate synthase [Asanoa sp. WMMD1127]
MRVTPIAHTLVDWEAVRGVLGGTAFADQAGEEFDVTDADHLAELAGRACYKAWGRKRPATATTAGYLDNILDQGHYSVLEHSSVTFYVEGVSRALLVELERHRFLSFSVESQRYVDQEVSHPVPTLPPLFDALPERTLWEALEGHYQRSLDLYRAAVAETARHGYSVKESREAARSFLPNSTPVDLIVTGNLRAWRDVLAKRYHSAADAEIRGFAAIVLGHLRELAPFSVQDFPTTPIAEAAHA